MYRSIQFGSANLIFSLLYQDRRSLGIKVYPDASVEVIAPLHSKESDIIMKLRSRAPWILKQVHYFNSRMPDLPLRRFVNGETHLYLGRQYRLRITPDEPKAVKAYRGHLIISSSAISQAVIEKQLHIWYKQRAELIFQEIFQNVLQRFKKYKITGILLSIRVMKRRWGSCTRSGRIILNLELIKTPKSCIEYVITHELCHLVHYNHTKAFFNLLRKMIPDWERRKERLENTLSN